MRQYDWRAIAANTLGNIAYWGRCVSWRAENALAWSGRAVRAVCFVALAGVLLVLMAVSTALFDLIRKGLWHLDENWLFALERGFGIIAVQDELPPVDHP